MSCGPELSTSGTPVAQPDGAAQLISRLPGSAPGPTSIKVRPSDSKSPVLNTATGSESSISSACTPPLALAPRCSRCPRSLKPAALPRAPTSPGRSGSGPPAPNPLCAPCRWRWPLAAPAALTAPQPASRPPFLPTLVQVIQVQVFKLNLLCAHTAAGAGPALLPLLPSRLRGRIVVA